MGNRSEHFVPGKLTSDVVGYHNNEEGKHCEGHVTQSFAFEAAGVELPVLRLADGTPWSPAPSSVRNTGWLYR